MEPFFSPTDGKELYQRTPSQQVFEKGFPWLLLPYFWTTDPLEKEEEQPWSVPGNKHSKREIKSYTCRPLYSRTRHQTIFLQLIVGDNSSIKGAKRTQKLTWCGWKVAIDKVVLTMSEVPFLREFPILKFNKEKSGFPPLIIFWGYDFQGTMRL